MRKIIVFIILYSSVLSTYAQTKSYKRGVGYGYHSVTDMQNYSVFLSWWYNWSTQPELAIRNIYSQFNVGFVPMAWNASGINGVEDWVSQDTVVKYILGFNEPNFIEQANMAPSQAAQAWPSLQRIADKYELKLVSPAVNYCGNCVSENGINYTDPFQYLDDFFDSCSDCRVDHIALHWYGGSSSIMGYIDDAKKYEKPIWITEFAAWDNSITNKQDQLNNLAGSVNFLEREPDIYRYAWFIGRTSEGYNSYPYIDLYSSDGLLTDLGKLYMEIPVYDSTYRFSIPGRIEVEEYYRMSGLYTELTSDDDGFLNIGWTDNNDWATYKIAVDHTGKYDISARVAGLANGIIELYVDDVLKLSVRTTSTGGWQNWQTIKKSIELEEGEHLLKMFVKRSGFNLNWLEISEQTSSVKPIETFNLKVFPNPVKNGLMNVWLQTDRSGGSYSCSLYSLTGQKIFSNVYNLEARFLQIDTSNLILSPGIYLLVVENEQSRAVKRLLFR